MLTYLDINGFQLHPIQSVNDTWLSLESIKGLGSPPPREETFNRPRAHGSVTHTQFYGDRIIELSGRILAAQGSGDDAVMTALAALKGAVALAGDADHEVNFLRAGDTELKKVYARVSAAVEVDFVPRNHLQLMWGAQLRAVDPRIYSAALRSVSSFPTGDSSRGMTWPLTFPLEFGAGGPGGISNGGNFPSPATITVIGPITDPIIENVTLGKALSFVGTINSGDHLVIDIKTRTITLAGTPRADLLDPSTSNWWEIVPGANEIRLSGSSLSLGTTQLIVEWRDAEI